MKKKKMVIILAVVVFVVIIVIFFFASAPNWSKKSFEAVVQEVITQPDGEIRLIVERTTEIYGDSLNSLGISKDTKLLGEDETPVSVEDFKRGVTIEVTLKDAFTEEAIFYYPTVYEIKIIQ